MTKLFTLALGGLMLLALSPAPALSQTVVQQGTIKGVVVGIGGQPVFGIQVRIVKIVKKHKHTNTSTDLLGIHHHRALGTTSTLRDGSFIITGVNPGEYRVIAGNKTIGRGHADVTVTSGQTSTAKIHLEPVTH